MWSQIPGQPQIIYIYSGSTLIGQISNTPGAPAYTAYTWGAAGLVSERLVGNNQSFWYAFGPQGETRQLTNATGTVVDTYCYTAYGVSLSTSPDPNIFQFGGQAGYQTEVHSPGGTILCGARWYDPALGRWLSRDPIGYDGGADLYAYCGDNPVGGVDPSGLAQDPGGPPNSLRLVLDAFIQAKQVQVDKYGWVFTFKGDGRGFCATGGSYRTQQQIVIDGESGGVLGVDQVGATRGLGGYFVRGYRGQSSPTTLHWHSIRVAGGWVVFLRGKTGDPRFHGLAPPLDYNIRIVIAPTGQIASVSGYHTMWPAFELYSYSNCGGRYTAKRVWSYDPGSRPLEAIEKKASFAVKF